MFNIAIVRSFCGRSSFYHSLHMYLVPHKRIRWTERWGEGRSRNEKTKDERNAIIFQYFMSYHLHIPDMFQNALVIFAYFAALSARGKISSYRKIGIFYSINHIKTSEREIFPLHFAKDFSRFLGKCWTLANEISIASILSFVKITANYAINSCSSELGKQNATRHRHTHNLTTQADLWRKKLIKSTNPLNGT